MQQTVSGRTWSPEQYEAMARRCSLVAAGIGTVGMAAWLLNLPMLTSWHRAYVPMSPVSAAGLTLLVYLYWQIANPPGSRFAPSTLNLKLSALCIGAVGAYCAFTGTFGLFVQNSTSELAASPKTLAGFAVSPL